MLDLTNGTGVQAHGQSGQKSIECIGCHGPGLRMAVMSVQSATLLTV